MLRIAGGVSRSLYAIDIIFISSYGDEHDDDAMHGERRYG